jgi:hypothetical protein
MLTRLKFFCCICILIGTSLSSCVSSGGSGASRLVDTFYKGKGQILFFVNNFNIKGRQGNPDINWDFTYDFFQDSIRPVIVNYSVYDKKFLIGPYSATLNGVALDSIRLLFADLQGSRHRTRFTGLISFDDFRKIALTNEVTLQMNYGPDSFIVSNSKRWKRKAQHIRSEFLDVIRITEFQRNNQ